MVAISELASDFCDYVTDGTHDSPKVKEQGKYLITSKHLRRYELDYSSANKISEQDYQKIMQRSSVAQWDILISMIGTIGNIYLETSKTVDYACKNVGIFKMGGNEKKAKWLYYYLQSPKAKEYIIAASRGTTQGYIPLNALRKLPIDVCDKKTRDEIVDILWSLDMKIKQNIDINDNLAHVMSRAKQRRYQPSGACSRKAVYRRCFIGRMPDSSRQSLEHSQAA